MLTMFAIPLLLVACERSEEGPGALERDPRGSSSTHETSDPDGTAPDESTPGGCPADAPRTDTIPSFCGQVPKNLLFLSIDTFRKPYLGHFGDKGLTPFLDSLTSSGFVLEDHAQCSNWTFAGVTCTMLGRYGEDAGWVAKLSGTYKAPLPDDTPMLATWLAEAGYYNVLVSANSWYGPVWNNTQGFQSAQVGGGRVLGVWGLAEDALATALGDGRVTDRWFLHMHVLDPHSPYNAPDAFNVGIEDLEPIPWDLKVGDVQYDMIGEWAGLDPDEQAEVLAWLHVLYAGEIRYTDAQIAQVFDELDARGWLDDTLVVIWNDHGEAFFEHGASTHAHWLYGEENDAFAFFWAKNIVPGTWGGPTTAIDLAPTILALLDLPMPPEVTGAALGTASPDRVRFASAYARRGVVQSIRRDVWRMQFHWASGQITLADLVADPEERVNLYDPAHVSPEALSLWETLLPEIERMQSLVPEKNVVWPAELPRPPSAR